MIPSIPAGCSKLCIMCYVFVGQVLALFLCKNINLHILFTALKLRIRTKVYKGLHVVVYRLVLISVIVSLDTITIGLFGIKVTTRSLPL